MLLSVIVPIFNVERYLYKCLESLKNQTFEDFEVILVNDGSTDNSKQICEKFIDDYNLENRFKLFDKNNGGLSDARNFGMKKAVGEFIAFLDSDDYFEPTCLDEMLKNVDTKTNIVQAGYFLTTEKKEKKIKVNSFTSLEEYIAYGTVVARNKIYRSEFLKKFSITFPNNLRYEDVYFYCRCIECLKSCDEIKTVDSCIVHYVQRKSSIMSTQNIKNLDILNIYGLLSSNKYKEALEYKCSHALNGSFFLKTFYIKDPLIRRKVRFEYKNFLQIEYPNWKNNIFYKKNTFKNFIIKRIIPVLYKIFK